MTSASFIAHVLDPLIDPRFAEQDLLLDKAFGSTDDQVTKEYVRNFKRTSVDSIDWAGDKLLIACSRDQTLRLWDPERGEKERSWSGEWMCVQSDPNNPFVAAAVSWYGKFRVFDTRSSTNHVHDVDLKKTSSAMKEFLCMSWSPDSKNICLGNRNDQLYMLNMASGLKLGASKHLQCEINQICWAPDGDSLWLAAGGSPGKLHIFPTPSLQADMATSVVAHQHAAVCLAADPTGKYIACGGGDCLATLWDPKHRLCVGSFGYATQAVTTLSFNHTGNLLAWGTAGPGTSGGERNLTIVGTNTGSLYWQDTTSAPVQNVKWHPSQNVLAYTVSAAQLPEDTGRDRRLTGRDLAVVHTLKVPDVP
mmetsp:Transcript_105701/g.268571  ORF Transcript_105701/g.268571 Transcript_105701/m.268571 type:complete len:364 (-) Transcript_105701:85-1176(-)